VLLAKAVTPAEYTPAQSKDKNIPTISKKGYILIEAESTKSKLEDWIIIQEGQDNYVAGASGKAQLEFQGNQKEGGEPNSPLEYQFSVKKDGNYALIMQTSKRLEGVRDDMCNDAYVKMSGDFDSANDLDVKYLKNYMKFFQQGGEIDNIWLWSTQVTDADHNFTHPTYSMEKDEIYTLTVAGRSKRYNIDYIVLYDTNKFTLEEIKKELDLLNPKSLRKEFNIKKDLLLAQYDSKTDVDDIHSIAAFATILASPEFPKLKYHAVAGAYGIQGGLYVPANELFVESFGSNWSDAHTDFEKAVNEVTEIVMKTLEKGGDIWIAEAGQSDFSAAWLKKVKATKPEIDTKSRVHLVQHGAWNEKNTAADKLEYVKKHTDYHKIPDGNAGGNGTPGYRTEKQIDWKAKVPHPKSVKVWEMANSICEKYNGQEGRYMNKAIDKGGFDFSDTAEISWILNIENADNVEQFFEVFGK
jgi:hypothetical protein